MTGHSTSTADGWPTIVTHRTPTLLVFRGADLLAIAAGLLCARSGKQVLGSDQVLALVMAVFVCHSFAAEFTGLYRSWRGSSLLRELVCAWWTFLLGLTGVLVLGALTQFGSGLTRTSFLAWTFLSCCALGLTRSTLRFVQSALRGYGINTRKYAVVGISEIGIRLARNIEDSPHLGLKLAGFFDDRPAARTHRLPVEFSGRSGTIDDLIERTRSGEISVVYVTFPLRAEQRIREVLERFADTTASVYIVPDFFVYELLHSRWNNILGIPVVSVFENPLYGVDGILKRAMDLVLGTLCLLILAMPMFLVAVLIKLSSRGPVFFRQRRYGLDGREIKVWKFRTMYTCEDGPHVAQARQGDPRVTPLGAFLRKTSLDELPQLFNVLGGSMSLVGPRPHATSHNEHYRSRIHGYMLRHKVRPGITGLAQVHGWRGETDTLYKMEKRIEYDHRYIREWSLWLDLKILVQTIFIVISGKNAY